MTADCVEDPDPGVEYNRHVRRDDNSCLKVAVDVNRFYSNTMDERFRFPIRIHRHFAMGQERMDAYYVW